MKKNGLMKVVYGTTVACGVVAVAGVVHRATAKTHEISRQFSPGFRERMNHVHALWQDGIDAWKKEHDYAKASSKFDEALAIDPMNHSLFETYAHMLEESGDKEKAAKYLYYVAHPDAKHGGSTQAYNADFMWHYAELSESIGRQDEAIYAYRYLVSHASDGGHQSPAMNADTMSDVQAKGAALLMLAIHHGGRPEQAQKLFSEAYRLAPNVPYVALFQARNLAQQHRSAEARAVYQHAVRAGDPEVARLAAAEMTKLDGKPAR